MKKFLFSLVFILILCSASYADIIYTTSNGKLGTIKFENAEFIDEPVVKYQVNDNDVIAASYWNGGESRVILVSRTTDIENASGDSAVIFKSSNLEEPLNTEAIILTGMYNTSSIAGSGNGRALYFTSGIYPILAEFNTSSFTFVRSYEYKIKSDDLYETLIQNVITDYSYIYALINTGESKSLFMRFDGQLKEGVENTIKKELNYNAYSMSLINNGRVAVGLSEGVNVFEGSNATEVVYTGQPVKSVCYNGSSGVYLITQIESNDKYINALEFSPIGSKTALDIVITENLTGKDPQMVRNNGVLAVMTDEKILMYRVSDNVLLEEFDNEDLGGYPTSIAVSSSSGITYNSSSSNCNLSGAGIIISLLLAGFITNIKR